MTVRSVTYPFTFNPAANTLDLFGFPDFDVRLLYLVIDETSQSLLYAPGTPNLGYTGISGSTLTLQASMQGCQAGDTLFIRYDDGAQLGSAAFVQLNVAGAALGNANPMPVKTVADSVGLSKDASLQTLITLMGSAGTGGPTLPGGSSGLLGWERELYNTLLGTLTTQGVVADASSISGNPFRVAGSDGSFLRTILTDEFGVQITGSGFTPVYNIQASAVIKAAKGRVGRLSVIAAGSVVGSLNDCLTTGAASTANQAFTIPMTVGSLTVDWRFATGITIIPGTGQTIALEYI